MDHMDFPSPGHTLPSSYGRPHLQPDKVARVALLSFLLLLLLTAFSHSRLPLSIQAFCRDVLSNSIFFDFASDMANVEAIRRGGLVTGGSRRGLVERKGAELGRKVEIGGHGRHLQAIAIAFEDGDNAPSPAGFGPTLDTPAPWEPSMERAGFNTSLIVLWAFAGLICTVALVMGVCSRCQKHQRQRKLFPIPESSSPP